MNRVLPKKVIPPRGRRRSVLDYEEIETAKPKLTKTTGQAKLVRLSDGNGLFLEVTETSKRWRARYHFEGKEQMLSLGVCPVVGLKDARDKNFLLRQQIAQGINPAIERKKEKSQIKEAVQEEKRIAKGEAYPMSMEAVALDWNGGRAQNVEAKHL